MHEIARQRLLLPFLQPADSCSHQHLYASGDELCSNASQVLQMTAPLCDSDTLTIKAVMQSGLKYDRKCMQAKYGHKVVVAMGDGATDLEARQPGGADIFIG